MPRYLSSKWSGELDCGPARGSGEKACLTRHQFDYARSSTPSCSRNCGGSRPKRVWSHSFDPSSERTECICFGKDCNHAALTNLLHAGIAFIQHRVQTAAKPCVPLWIVFADANAANSKSEFDQCLACKLRICFGNYDSGHSVCAASVASC